MKQKKLVLRCYAKRDGDIWIAVCVDLSLAAQARSLQEAKAKLDAQIHEYVMDAVVGQDKEHCELLLNRKSPVSELVTYYAINVASTVHNFAKNVLHSSSGNTREIAYRQPAPRPLVC